MSDWRVDQIHRYVDELAAVAGCEKIGELESEINKLNANLADLKTRYDLMVDDKSSRPIEMLGRELQDALNANGRLRADADRIRNANRTAARFMGGCKLKRGGFYVYQLFAYNELVYVGKSASLAMRLSGHRDKDWTEVTWEELPTQAKMDEREIELIHQTHPRDNKVCYVCHRGSRGDPLRWLADAA